MIKKLMIGRVAALAFVVVVAVQAIAGAASVGKAGSAKLEQTQPGTATDSSCECVCGSPRRAARPVSRAYIAKKVVFKGPIMRTRFIYAATNTTKL